jgi:hypothetical protein
MTAAMRRGEPSTAFGVDGDEAIPARVGAFLDRPWGAGLLVLLAFAAPVWVLWNGAGYLLDDWFSVGNATVHGAIHTAAEPGQSRPGSIAVFALFFGPLRYHLWVSFLALGAVNAAAALVARQLLRSVSGPTIAFVAVALWMIIPARTSTEVWITCVIASTSLLFLVCALCVVDQCETGWAAACLAGVLGMGSVLCYEASGPLVVAGALALAWWRWRRLVTLPAAGALLGSGAAGAWIVLHWYSGKERHGQFTLSRAIFGHFGWPIGTAAAAAIAVAVVRWFGPERVRRRTDAERTVLLGVAVIAAGSAPFVFYWYEPTGAGDRVLYASSLGAAMVWAGGLAIVWSSHRLLAAVAAVALLVPALLTHVQRLDAWHRAESDGMALLAALPSKLPNPGPVVVFGPPPPVRENVVTLLDDSNADGLLKAAYHRTDIRGRVARTIDEFEATDPSSRVDLREFDTLGRLEP